MGVKFLKNRSVFPYKNLVEISSLTLDKKLSREEFVAFAKIFPELRMEREKNGKVTIMSPVKFGSGKRELHVGGYLFKWWDASGEPGEVFGPSTGIELADTSIKSPDCGWISEERLAQIPPEDEDGEYLQIAPDFVVEVRSKTDSIAKLKRKMENSWMKNGVRLGWLIDPYRERIFIYREGKSIEEILGFDGVVLSGENVLLGFELSMEKMKIRIRKK